MVFDSAHSKVVLRGIRLDFQILFVFMFYIYILKSQINDSYYIGSCKNVPTRFKQHNQSLVSSTKRYVPWGLMYTEEYDRLKQARNRERQIKSWKKRSAIEKLMANKI